MENYKKIAGSMVQFSLEIDKGDLDKAQKSVITQAKQNFSTKGFRKGHAPEKVVIEHFGLERIAYEALNKSIDNKYRDFVMTEKIAVIAAPEVDLPKNEKPPMKINFKVEVYPSVEIGDYKKLKIKKPEIIIEDKEIEDVLMTLCAQMENGKKVKRAAKKGDLIEVDFAGKDKEGNILPNTEGKNHKFRLGMGHFLPDLEKAFEKMKAGESKKAVKVSFPKEYHSKDFAGKTVPFDITLHDVYEIDPKNLTEDDIEKIAGKKQSLTDLKKQIRSTITMNKEQSKQKEALDEYNKKLAKVVKVDLPKSWITQEIQSRLNRLKQSPQYKQDPENFWKTMGKKEEDLQKEFEKEGIEGLKVFLGLSEIVKTENIELNKDELNEVNRMAETQSKASRTDIQSEIQKAILNLKIDKYLRNLMN